jgi:hypothetical protein
MLLLGVGTMVNSQAQFKIDNSSSTLILEGTSNLHDWEMKAVSMKGNLFATLEKGKPVVIQEVQFSLPAGDIVSGNSIMDNKTQKALNTEKHRSITFTLSEPLDLDPGNNAFSGTARGNLTVSGISRDISLPFTAFLNDDNSLKITGTKMINMRDFKVDPPTAMMGALKTGEQVNVRFSIEFEPSISLSQNNNTFN